MSYKLNERPRLPRRQARLHQRHGDRRDAKHKEPQSAHRPRKPNFRQQRLDHRRKDHPPSRIASSSDRKGQCAVLSKVRGDTSQSGGEEEPIANASADALRQEQVPIPRRERSHEDAYELQHGTRDEHSAKVARVGGAAGDGSDGEQEEDLDGADPGDGGRRLVQGVDVVGLEYSEGVDVAPRVEDDKVTHQSLGPGLKSAVGRWAGINGRGPGQGLAYGPEYASLSSCGFCWRLWLLVGIGASTLFLICVNDVRDIGAGRALVDIHLLISLSYFRVLIIQKVMS